MCLDKWGSLHYHLVKLAKLGAQEYTQNLYLAHRDTLNISLNILFDVLFYDDFNRPATNLATDWSIYEDRWRELPMGDKQPYQTQAFCLGLVEDTSFCAYLYKRDSLLIDQVTACTLFVQQYDNTGYLAAFANGELLPGIGTLPSGISKASLDKYIGRKLRLSFYGCPNAYIDNLLIAGYK